MTPEDFTFLLIASLADLRAALWMVAAGTGALTVATLIHTAVVVREMRRR